MKARELASMEAQRKGQGNATDQNPASTSDEAEEVRRIQAMIKDSPDLINAPDSQSGRTPLQAAANEGHLVVARFLLQNGADVEAKLRSGRNPLHVAASQGHKAMVELLLSHKAGVNATDLEGRTPLHLAAQRGFRSVAEVLVANGADVNSPAKDGETPLLSAVANGYTGVADLLLSRGAAPNAGAPLPPLHLAAQRGDLPMTQLLLSNHANVNLEDGKGRTPLSYAATAQSAPVIKTLLAAHADPNAGRVDLPLSIAAFKGDLPSLGLLLTNGSNPKALTPVDFEVHAARFTSPEGGTFSPLYLAVTQDHPVTAGQLLRAGADPNEPLPFGGDPIIFEMLWNTNMLQVLLDGGADPNRPSRDGTLPLRAALNENTEVPVAILLAHGANPNTVGKDGWTPLFSAAGSGRSRSAELLLSHGADINARDENGRTPLLVAVQNDKPSMVQLLLERGADPNIRDNSGSTPLEVANPSGPGSSFPKTPGLGVRPPNLLSPQPLGYQWNKDASTSPKSVSDLLRQHGAVENLPRLDRISVQRSSTGYTEVAFKKSTNDWNHFTLLELLAMQYHFLGDSPAGGGDRNGYTKAAFMSRFYSSSLGEQFSPWLQFPDVAHIKVRRPGADLKHWQDKTVDFNSVLESGDCSTDVPLDWGDVVEIPEADHPLDERWKGFSDTELENLKKCLTRQVEIVIKNKTTTITLAPGIVTNQGRGPTTVSIKDERDAFWTKGSTPPPEVSRLVIIPGAPFWLKPVLLDSKLVLASSDLSRVKVTRHDAKTGKNHEWTIDCRVSSPAPNLWLVDGDSIDVPDR
jgi:ankyrin repeat protein